MSASRFSPLDLTCGVGVTLKLDRKIMAEHRGVIYQTNQKRTFENIGHSFRVLDPLNKELQLIVAWDRVREEKVFEKGVHHKRA